jgi:hypothetical protein
MEALADPPHDFLLDRTGLAANARREVAAPALVEAAHLRQSRGLAVGDSVANSGLQVSRALFEHPSIRSDEGARTPLRDPRAAVGNGGAERESPSVGPDGVGDPAGPSDNCYHSFRPISLCPAHGRQPVAFTLRRLQP